MNCSNCGAPLRDGAAFCPRCGSRQMTEASPQPTPYSSPYPQPTPYPSPYPQPTPYPSPQPPKKKKWVVPMLIALVAALLIGGGVFLLLQDSDEDEKDASDTERSATDDFDAEDDVWEDASDTESSATVDSDVEDDVWEDAFDTGRSGDPEDVVHNYFTAMQDGDVDALKECYPEAYLDAAAEAAGYDSDELDEYLQIMVSVLKNGTIEYEILDEDPYSKSELEDLNDEFRDEIGIEFTDAIEYEVSYDFEMLGEKETYEVPFIVVEMDGRWYRIEEL